MTPQRILIDVTRSPSTGIGRYSWNLLRHLSRTNDKFEFMGLTFKENEKYAKLNELEIVKIPHNPTNDIEVHELSKLINSVSNLYIATNFSQIVYPTVPVIQVVHDLIYILNTEWHPTSEDLDSRHGKKMMNYVYTSYLPNLEGLLRSNSEGLWRTLISNSVVSKLYVHAFAHSIYRARAHIMVSQTTKELVQQYFAPSRPNKVLYPILDEQFRHESKLEPDQEDELTILYVANFELRKNHRMLFEAVRYLPKRLKDRTKLVLIGQPLFKSHFLSFMKDVREIEREVRIELYSKITERAKRSLFLQASILVHPSLDEGFGIPLLEAMMLSLPILTLDLTIYREVCGEGAVYIRDMSPENLAREIERLYADPETLDRILKMQKLQLSKFRPDRLNQLINTLIWHSLR